MPRTPLLAPAAYFGPRGPGPDLQRALKPVVAAMALAVVAVLLIGAALYVHVPTGIHVDNPEASDVCATDSLAETNNPATSVCTAPQTVTLRSLVDYYTVRLAVWAWTGPLFTWLVLAPTLHAFTLEPDGSFRESAAVAGWAVGLAGVHAIVTAATFAARLLTRPAPTTLDAVRAHVAAASSLVASPLHVAVTLAFAAWVAAVTYHGASAAHDDPDARPAFAAAATAVAWVGLQLL